MSEKLERELERAQRAKASPDHDDRMVRLFAKARRGRRLRRIGGALVVAAAAFILMFAVFTQGRTNIDPIASPSNQNSWQTTIDSELFSRVLSPRENHEWDRDRISISVGD